MNVTCPNDPEHDKFSTTQHVMEEIVVDGDGEFVDRIGFLEVTQAPDPGNVFHCRTCGSEATVTI